jgi:hypothetical protein
MDGSEGNIDDHSPKYGTHEPCVPFDDGCAHAITQGGTGAFDVVDRELTGWTMGRHTLDSICCPAGLAEQGVHLFPYRMAGPTIHLDGVEG